MLSGHVHWVELPSGARALALALASGFHQWFLGCISD